MAAGEYVSVRSQREMYEYQIALEREEVTEYPEEEAEELALIYEARGVDIDKAREVRGQVDVLRMLWFAVGAGGMERKSKKHDERRGPQSRKGLRHVGSAGTVIGVECMPKRRFDPQQGR